MLPVANVEGAKRMSAMNGAAFPSWLEDRLTQASGSDRVAEIGVEAAAELSATLIAEGAPGYSTSTPSIARGLPAQLSAPSGCRPPAA